MEEQVQYTGQRALAVRDDIAMPPTFDAMMKHADVMVKSGLMPVEVKTPAQVVVVAMTGRDFGWSMMQSVRSIFVVKGKPTLSAQAMGALIWQAGHAYHIDESTNKRCAITFQRKGQPKGYTHTFTYEDAQAAGLTNSPTWKSYTKAMLFSRCMSAGARAYMPDVVLGMYTPEEIAGPDAVVLDEGGEVVKVINGEFKPVDEAPAKPEPQPVTPAPAGASRQATRGQRLSKLEELKTAISELDPKDHNKFWATNHIKKHYKVDSATSLSDEQLDAVTAEFTAVYAELSGEKQPAKDYTMPEGLGEAKAA